MNNASIPKRFGLVAVLAAVLMVLATSIALAAMVTGTAGDDTLRGTERGHQAGHPDGFYYRRPGSV